MMDPLALSASAFARLGLVAALLLGLAGLVAWAMAI